MSNWLDKEVSFYKCQADNKGTPASYRNILFTDFAMMHKWWAMDHETKEKRSGISNDLQTLIELRKLPPDSDKQKRNLKAILQCFTPSALLVSKKNGEVAELNRTGIMQLDFDYKDINSFDVEELKQSVFSLPFIGFCGLSCGGKGFYALALIAEPNRLADYAEHCFDVLQDHGVKADTSKGKKVENLRYVSYDCNMLIRHNPEPLQIKAFKQKPVLIKRLRNPLVNTDHKQNGALIRKQLKVLTEAMNGNRMSTVQKVAYTLGGTNDLEVLKELKNCISNTSTYADDLESFIRCANDCFKYGSQKPLTLLKS